jgi:hypothetical protein
LSAKALKEIFNRLKIVLVVVGEPDRNCLWVARKKIDHCRALPFLAGHASQRPSGPVAAVDMNSLMQSMHTAKFSRSALYETAEFARIVVARGHNRHWLPCNESLTELVRVRCRGQSATVDVAEFAEGILCKIKSLFPRKISGAHRAFARSPNASVCGGDCVIEVKAEEADGTARRWEHTECALRLTKNAAHFRDQYGQQAAAPNS